MPVSLSSEVVPEMQEYERTITTVANSYVRPRVAEYVKNLQNGLKKMRKDIKLQILRSDGGLASAKATSDSPVNLLMSGPAGGVSGAIWIAKQAGFENIGIDTIINNAGMGYRSFVELSEDKKIDEIVNLNFENLNVK